MSATSAATVAERLTWSLAQQTRPGDVLVVGVATPVALCAGLLARATSTPDLVVIAAATVDPALHDVAVSMSTPERLDAMGVVTLDQAEILDQIQRGRVTLQFVSPAQVDGQGRLNTSRVRRSTGEVRRLPGGLATGDIAVLVGRLVAYRADHSPRFLPEQVEFVTGAGHDRGVEWRAGRKLPGSGVAAIVTDKAVLAWNGAGFVVASVHPGASLDEVVAGCGFPLDAGDPPPGSEPPPEALELLRTRIDPHGVRDLEVRADRAAALDTLERLRS